MELYLHSLFRFHGVMLRSTPFPLFCAFFIVRHPSIYSVNGVRNSFLNLSSIKHPTSINKPAEIWTLEERVIIYQSSPFQVFKNRRMEQQVSSSNAFEFYSGGFPFESQLEHRSSSISPDKYMEMMSNLAQAAPCTTLSELRRRRRQVK
jgi:hypothetical protein